MSLFPAETAKVPELVNVWYLKPSSAVTIVPPVAVSNNTTIDIAYGTAVVVTDNAQGAVEELNVSAESGAVTIAGSPGDDELCFFRIGRDVSGDGMAGDARLVGIKLFFTTDLANDG